MRVLTYTTLFPNEANPLHALFVRARVAAVASRCSHLRVVAPVPWFPRLPFGLPTRWERYRRYAQVPHRERQGRLWVDHPRFPTLPGIGKGFDGHLLEGATRGHVRRLHAREGFDLIDAHWAYPDGFAAVRIGRRLGVPVVLTVRGDDLSSMPEDPRRRPRIVAALEGATRIVAVCSALRDAAIALGAPPERVTVIGNGIDLSHFHPIDRQIARRRLGLPEGGRMLLSVGHLCERKGFHLLIEAVGKLAAGGMRDLFLVIVGGGGEEGDVSGILARMARALPPGTVRLVGPKPPEELSLWYSAADLFCLASAREGWANVLLEALACGTPVVGTNVWGIPEVISSPKLGILRERTPQALAEGIALALSRPWSREDLVRHAQGRSWDVVAGEVVSLFREVLGERRSNEAVQHENPLSSSNARGRRGGNPHPGDRSRLP